MLLMCQIPGALLPGKSIVEMPHYVGNDIFEVLDVGGRQEVLNCLHLGGKGAGAGGGDLVAEEFQSGDAKKKIVVTYYRRVILMSAMMKSARSSRWQRRILCWRRHRGAPVDRRCGEYRAEGASIEKDIAVGCMISGMYDQ